MNHCGRGMKVYVAETGCDPSPLIQRDLMSDEASGPENEDEDEWLQSMAVKSGLATAGEESPTGGYAINFREHIKPNWRSAEVSLIDSSLKHAHHYIFTSFPRFI